MTDWIRISVVATRGSAPRGAGTQMRVWADRTEGTIGGGALEWAAMGIARDMLEDGSATAERTMPLGPELGQCCGGAVTLRWDRSEISEVLKTPLWIWGAGHVGRALASTLAPLPDVAVTWIDTHADRFPGTIPDGAERVTAVAPQHLVQHAPQGAWHLVVTHSHQLDLDICHGLLSRGFAFCGLIGSDTKWARFRSRLRQLGHQDAVISRITCPIGDPRLGKDPQAIAVGVAAGLLSDLRTQRLDNTGT